MGDRGWAGISRRGASKFYAFDSENATNPAGSASSSVTGAAISSYRMAAAGYGFNLQVVVTGSGCAAS